mmetsp:Transcript_27277/g.64402  ORF Transcript_27277/g.64402 Transcript_27277/m.64402 type:complete len:303 (-) Transcript_27277:294-1202(-)
MRRLMRSGSSASSARQMRSASTRPASSARDASPDTSKLSTDQPHARNLKPHPRHSTTSTPTPRLLRQQLLSTTCRGALLGQNASGSHASAAHLVSLGPTSPSTEQQRAKSVPRTLTAISWGLLTSATVSHARQGPQPAGKQGSEAWRDARVWRGSTGCGARALVLCVTSARAARSRCASHSCCLHHRLARQSLWQLGRKTLMRLGDTGPKRTPTDTLRLSGRHKPPPLTGSKGLRRPREKRSHLKRRPLNAQTLSLRQTVPPREGWSHFKLRVAALFRAGDGVPVPVARATSASRRGAMRRQ